MYDTSIASTGQNVASLMYSMQMTGYMFRSAEYRRSLMESLSAAGESSGLLPPEAGEMESELPNLLPQVQWRLAPGGRPRGLARPPARSAERPYPYYGRCLV